MPPDPSQAELEAQEEDRAEKLRLILASDARRKLIVAGPGTGKTHTFREVLAQAPIGLAMTFIKALHADMEVKLGKGATPQLADAYTFHGFCKNLMHGLPLEGLTSSFDYYPPLEPIIRRDIKTVERRPMNKYAIPTALLTLDMQSGLIPLVLRSGTYYDACGYDDAVYRVYLHLDANTSSVPSYPLVVVDEYQDFSPLEVGIIRLLADVSPVLVVGDDDQALYAFRHADAQFIRDLAGDEDYERFELPWCSRCTRVMVEATHEVIARARAEGLLSDRIPKPYECFLPKKLPDSQSHPKLIHAKCSLQNGSGKANYPARYIEQQIRQIPQADIIASRQDGYPTVLILGRANWLTDGILDYLRGPFPGIRGKDSAALEPKPLDGYERLLKDDRSRMGWRILMYVQTPPKIGEILRRALVDDEELVDLLPKSYRARHLAIVELLQRLLDQEELCVDEEVRLQEATELSIADILERLGHTDDEPEPEAGGEEVIEGEGSGDAELDILVTTLVGAKGLQAEHVFVVGMHEGDFPQHEPTDEEVCCLIVALTRGTKTCTLVSADRFGGDPRQPSRFLEWLGPHLKVVSVNKAFFAD